MPFILSATFWFLLKHIIVPGGGGNRYFVKQTRIYILESCKGLSKLFIPQELQTLVVYGKHY